MKRKTLAIPIRCVDYSNTSQVVSLFTRESGLLEGIAKGAHREKNAFQGPFDLAELREIVYIERKSPALAILAEAAVVDGFRGVRRSWGRYVAACLVLEILRVVATAGNPICELFDLVRATLDRLGSSSPDDLSLTLLHFEIRALRLLGFLGAVEGCVSCGRRWPGGDRSAFFSPQDGGLICRRCRGASRPFPSRRDGVLPGRGVELLGHLARDEGERTAWPCVERTLLSRLHRLLGQCYIISLERPLRMLKYSATWS